MTMLAELDDTGLAAAFDRAADDTADRAAVLAEAERRDQADARMAKARRALDKIRHDAECAVQAQFLAASEACAGRLLSRAGMAAGVAERDLWRMPAGQLARLGSEELNDHFAFTSPRITVASYVRQHAAEARAARIDALDQAEVPASAELTREETTDHEHTDPGPELARNDAGPLRLVTSASEAPQAGTGGPLRRGGGGPEPADAGQYAEAGARRPGRPAQPARGVLTMAERIDGYMARGRERAAALVGGPERAAGTMRSGTVAVPPSVADDPLAMRAAGTVAVREPGQIPGAQLLDLIRDKWFGRYARFPSASALDVVTLWAVHCHMRDAEGTLVFGATPRLYLLSSEPGSGKSRVLELIGMIVPACFGLDVEPTKQGVVYSLARERATILLDEGDIMFGSGQRRADVRAVLNASYRRHGTVVNGRGGKANRVSVFGAVAVAGLDTMVTGTGEALKALLTRGIRISMRKASGEDRPAKLTRASEAEAGQAKKWLAAWAAQVRGELADAEPDMPAGLDGRQEEIWQPLISIADAAGGQWPARARAACAELALADAAAGEDAELADEFAEFAESFGTDTGEW